MDEHITISEPAANKPILAKLEQDWQVRGFSLLFACASLLIVWQRWAFATASPWLIALDIALSLTAFVALVRPRWSGPWLVLGGLHLVFVIWQAPLVRSHEMLCGFFGVSICISYITHTVATRSWVANPVQVYRSFVPTLRLIFLFSLGAMGLARWNWAFLDLSASPIVSALTQLRNSPVPDWVSFFTMSLLLVVDLMLAVSLLVPSLRRFAVGVGSVYVCWQAWIGVGETVLLVPVFLLGFFLFTSTEFVSRLVGCLHRYVPAPAVRRSGLPIYVLVTVMVGIAIRFQQLEVEQTLPVGAESFVNAACVALTAAWIILLLTNLVDARPRLTWVSLLPKNVAHYGVLTLFIVTLSSPYLGLGDVARLTDATGFVAIGQRNNHLLVPQSPLMNLGMDRVEILASSDPYLASLASSQLQPTWFEMVDYLQLRPETSIDFMHDGQRYQVQRAGDYDVFSTPSALWTRKLARFTPLSSGEITKMANDRRLARP